MSLVNTIADKYSEIQSQNGNVLLHDLRQKGYEAYNRMGFPTQRHEEWKYTRLNALVNKNYKLPAAVTPSADVLANIRLQKSPAAELFFVNGVFAKHLSFFDKDTFVVLTFHEAAESEYDHYLQDHLGHSGKYMKDGMNALNTAFLTNGLFVLVRKNKVS